LILSIGNQTVALGIDVRLLVDASLCASRKI